MKTKNKLWIWAGIVNLLGALVHTILGQTTLVDPMLSSNMPHQPMSEMLAVWHMVTVALFLTSFYLIRSGLGRTNRPTQDTVEFISYFYVLASVVFIIVSVVQQILAPQWILLLPISILGFLGLKKIK